MEIVKNRFLPWGSFVVLTIGPWIFTRREAQSETTVRHEAIHWEQQKETAVVGFLVLYAAMFLWELVRCSFDRSRGTRADGRHRPLRKRAYRSIAFEREAYRHEGERSYLRERKRWAWARRGN